MAKSKSKRQTEVINLYGGKATYQEIPQQPVSPRGLASDMSTVAAFTGEES